MQQTTIQRITAETSRASEYFSTKELQAMTGQPVQMFGAVVLKELIDNALDACETANVAPEISVDVCNGDTDGMVVLTITDNGSGIPASTIKKLIDFSVRASDKAVYKSPTRGAQGNALKTVLGIPQALGVDKPVVIEAQGNRHTIRAWADPAGNVRVAHAEDKIERTTGTSIMLHLPEDILFVDVWARQFATFNPHALVKFAVPGKRRQESLQANSDKPKTPIFYQPSVNGTWRKYIPTDPTSPWWYSADDLARLVFAHTGAVIKGERDLTLREFVRQFRGLTGTAKAKRVCEQLPDISRLSDFDANPSRVADLHQSMLAEAKNPSPETMGFIGDEHFRKRFIMHGLKEGRFWYKRISGYSGDIPFLVEVAIGQVENDALFHGVNFSPTFDDPVSGTWLHADGKLSGSGLRGFLSNAHCDPFPGGDCQGHNVAAALHIVCPALSFLDRGKTRLTVSKSMADAVATALWSACKVLYSEAERRRKDAARQERADREHEREADKVDEPSLKSAVFDILPQATAHTTGGGEYGMSVRDLFYSVRPLAQNHTSRELEYNYFSQTLLTEYQRINGPIEKLYYDPRGVLYEPHTGEAIQLGTREVEIYDFPSLVYDKILYIEKKGFWQALKDARIGERYDMAIITAEGYATEAIRMIFKRADKDKKYTLFVLHDADPHGYNIARTLREETARMPGYSVDVVDLGFFLEECLDLGLEAETFTRKKALPSKLELTPLEMEYFSGRKVGKKSWIAQRIELNAMTPPKRIEYLERKLKEHGADRKIIPDRDRILEEMQDHAEERIAMMVEKEIQRRLNIDTMIQAAIKQVGELVFEPDAVVNKLDGCPAKSWRDYAKDIAESVARREMESISWEEVINCCQGDD